MFALICVEPALRGLDDVVLEVGFLHEHLHRGLIAHDELDVGAEVAEGGDGGEELDGPLMDTDGEDTVVETVPVFRVDEMHIIKLTAWLGQENLNRDVRIEDDSIGVEPEEPFEALAFRFGEFAQQEAEDVGGFGPDVIHDLLAKDVQAVAVLLVVVFVGADGAFPVAVGVAIEEDGAFADTGSGAETFFIAHAVVDGLAAESFEACCVVGLVFGTSASAVVVIIIVRWSMGGRGMVRVPGLNLALDGVMKFS